MEDEELDISWIREQEQLLNADNYQISPLVEIPIHVVYVNAHGVVETNDTLHYSLSSNGHLTHSALVLLQKQYQKLNYLCVDTVYYHFDIRPEHIQDYVTADHNANVNPYLKTYVGENGIHFPPIIKLFHTFSAIYIFYREVEHAPLPKPILKIGGIVNGNVKGNTKKVRIVCDVVPTPVLMKPSIKVRKTRKYLPQPK